MSLRMNLRKILRPFGAIIWPFWLVVMVFCAYNIYQSGKTFAEALRPPEIEPYVAETGRDFVPLRPYLKGMRLVGFMTERESRKAEFDSSIMGPYQAAQYILSPTLLDYFHASNYEYVILYCENAQWFTAKVKSLKARPVIAFSNGIGLIKRKLP